MAFRGMSIRTLLAIGSVLTISGLSTANAQFGPRQSGPLYRPAKDAKDLRAVLFNWTGAMGMLRGLDEHKLVATLEYQGKGTIQVEGQPCTLTKYRISNNYQTLGERVQYTCTRPKGQTYSAIEVVSGEFAREEDIPGAEIVSGKGKATPTPAAVREAGQVYVRMPVPASVRAAVMPTAKPTAWTEPGPAASSDQSKPTPRLTNGKPDLTGVWNVVTGNPTGRYGNRLCGPTQATGCTPGLNFTVDYEIYSPFRYGSSRPCTNPSFGTRSKIWTSGRTRMILS
jgi:hypothetical protein